MRTDVQTSSNISCGSRNSGGCRATQGRSDEGVPGMKTKLGWSVRGERARVSANVAKVLKFIDGQCLHGISTSDVVTQLSTAQPKTGNDRFFLDTTVDKPIYRS